ncbi:MAG: FkbM family methyltransferase [Chitinophagaceae bacterium]|jgi:FkbM family methyltransferase
MTEFINKLLSKIGVQVKPYPAVDLKRRISIVHHFEIDNLLDIGANAGQYAKQMRELGYANRIISFEPANEAFQQLSKTAKHDGNWIVNQYALGEKDEKVIINVSQNSLSSSILSILPEHVQSAPSSAFIAQQETEVKKLDVVFN